MREEKRFYRVIIIFMLVLSLICSSCTSNVLAFSGDAEARISQINTSPVKYRKLTLEELFGYLQNDPDAHNLTLSGESLSYNLTNGINVSIELIITGNTYEYIFHEGDRIDSLKIDTDNNTMLVNDSPASVSIHTVTFYPAEHVTGTDATWIQLGQTTYYDAYVENQVRNATAALILTILYATVAGIAGVSLGICSTIIQFFGNLNSTSKYFYVGRGIFYDNDFSQHYMQKCWYYEKSNYTNLITTSEYEEYTVF